MSKIGIGAGTNAFTYTTRAEGVLPSSIDYRRRFVPYSFQPIEVMFEPNLLDIESEVGGVHNMVHKAIGACDEAEQSTMYSNMVLAGANTLFPFLLDRLKIMVANLAVPDTKIDIAGPPERDLSTWIGGSIFASSQNFQKSCIKKSEYEEHGSGVVHQKTFF